MNRGAMFGLDEWLVQLAEGHAVVAVLAVALLLGLRHATDPDHLMAVSTLLASEAEGDARRASRLGLAWGVGHASTLLLFGLPIVLFHAYLPAAAQRGAEVLVGLVIVFLGIRLLVRRRARIGRSPAEAFGVGLVHGMAGSAGVGVLLLAALPARSDAVAALVVLAVGTAISMAVLSHALGRVVAGRRIELAPAMGALTCAFGAWYALGAAGAVPYV
jgi:hypothetical protein